MAREIDVREASFDDIVSIVERMRPTDRFEGEAMRGALPPLAYAEELWRLKPQMPVLAVIFEKRRWQPGMPDAKPIALLTVFSSSPHLGQAALVATPEWRRIVVPLTVYIRDFLVPVLRRCGMRRVEVRALKSYASSCRWIERLGARRECDLENYGRSGETFTQFAFLA